jgi:hypothetical protein
MAYVVGDVSVISWSLCQVEATESSKRLVLAVPVYMLTAAVEMLFMSDVAVLCWRLLNTSTCSIKNRQKKYAGGWV